MNDLTKKTISLLNQNTINRYRHYYDGTIEDFVEACIRHHQDQYPGSWQEWNIDKKAKDMASMVRQAIKAKEFYPARAVLYFG